jgi:hypothetical protein
VVAFLVLVSVAAQGQHHSLGFLDGLLEQVALLFEHPPAQPLLGEQVGEVLGEEGRLGLGVERGRVEHFVVEFSLLRRTVRLDIDSCHLPRCVGQFLLSLDLRHLHYY